MDDEEQVSGTGEGDEIMEEPEEQEDGYSTSISHLLDLSPLQAPCLVAIRSLNLHSLC